MVDTDALNVIHPRAAGLDVHKMQITATIHIAQSGGKAETSTQEFKALPSGLAELVAWLDDHQVTAAVLEATGIYWENVFDALENAGIKPLLVHAQHVKQIRGRKTDVADSIWLARICQYGLCSPSFIPPALFRELRQVSRARRKIVGHRATLRNQIHKVIDRAGIRVGGLLSDLFGVNGQRILDGLVEGQPSSQILASLSHHVRHKLVELCDALEARLSDNGRFILADQLEAWRTASRRIERYDARIADLLEPYRAQIDLLTTIPGIDREAAQAIFIEIGPDPEAFASRRHLAAWAGLAPGNNESAGKRRSGRVRMGNRTLRSVLVECAHAAARTKGCQFHGYHKALTVRRGYKRATVATAHKMLRAIHTMLRTGEVYRDPKADYEKLMAMRNAPRWIRMLQKHNLVPANWEVPETNAA